MKVLTVFVNALRRIFGTEGAGDIEGVRVFEDASGKWRFQTPDGTITWGSYPTRADAIRAAQKYNFFKVVVKKG